MNFGLASNRDYFASRDSVDCSQNGWRKRSQTFDGIIWRGQDDNCQADASQILLIGQIAINCHEDVERSILNQAQQSPILDARPPHFWNGVDLMTA